MRRSNWETPYYEYVLLYVDDCLVISDQAESVIWSKIGKYLILKEESIGDPGQYIVGKLRKVIVDNGAEAWDFGSKQYVEEAVNNVVDYLEKRNRVTSGYRPEIDVTAELDAADASYYHFLIGILRWIVDLGRIDITCEISMLSSHFALPREGHLEEVLHVYAW